MLRRGRRSGKLHFPSQDLHEIHELMGIIHTSPQQGTKWFRKNRSGQAMVEFLLSVLVLLIVVVGIIEMIGLIYTYTVLADAAKEGVRYAVVHGCDKDGSMCSGTCTLNPCTDSTADNVTAYARKFLGASLHDPSAIPVTVSYPDGNSKSTSVVRVTISYPYQPLFGFSWPTLTVRAKAEGRIFY